MHIAYVKRDIRPVGRIMFSHWSQIISDFVYQPYFSKM